MPKTKSPTDRWAWVEIDLNAIRRNTRAFKSLLEPRVQMMCAVKADGYGHGAVACAKAMHAAGADQFAVATLKEGVELREAGITWPILMLNQSPMESIDTLVKYDIMPAVYEPEFALAYGECAAANNKVGKYHLAIDTGMTRIGVMPDEAVELRRQIDFHRGLECAGTFTHFATAEVPGTGTLSSKRSASLTLFQRYAAQALKRGLSTATTLQPRSCILSTTMTCAGWGLGSMVSSLLLQPQRALT